MDEHLEDLLKMGREHYARREYDLAAQVLDQVLERTDKYADVHRMMGVILHDRGDVLAAEACFERALAQNPHDTEALMNLAVTRNDLGRYEAAREVCQRIQAVNAGTVLDAHVRGRIAGMHADLAQAYQDTGCPREAIAQLRTAVELCPGRGDLQTRLGSLHRDMGDHALAREHYTAAIAADPGYAAAHVLLGVTMLALGSADQAIAAWRAALAVDPENKPARMYLRVVEAQRNAARAAMKTIPYGSMFFAEEGPEPSSTPEIEVHNG